jgi:hypothetical protein
MAIGDLGLAADDAKCGCGESLAPFERLAAQQGPGLPEVWRWSCLRCTRVEMRLGIPGREQLARQAVLLSPWGWTSVVNIRRHPYDVYIGRAGGGQDGYFGNPVAFDRRCPVCWRTHTRTDIGDAMDCFDVLFHEKLAKDPEYRRRVWGLAGKALGCFCKQRPDDGRPCHGDVYARYLNRYCANGRRSTEQQQHQFVMPGI